MVPEVSTPQTGCVSVLLCSLLAVRHLRKCVYLHLVVSFLLLSFAFASNNSNIIKANVQGRLNEVLCLFFRTETMVTVMLLCCVMFWFALGLTYVPCIFLLCSFTFWWCCIGFFDSCAFKPQSFDALFYYPSLSDNEVHLCCCYLALCSWTMCSVVLLLLFFILLLFIGGIIITITFTDLLCLSFA